MPSVKKKSIQSENKELLVTYDDVQNVCICVVLYSLLQYLLLVDEESSRKRTIYIFGDGISPKIRERLPSIYFETQKNDFKSTLKKRFNKLILRFFKNLKYPFLERVKFFAQDHEYTSMLIGSRNYALLSDGPHSLSYILDKDSGTLLRQKEKQRSIFGRLERLLYGNLSLNFFGNNSQCKTIYLTEPNELPYKDKEIVVSALKSLWDSSSESKKQFILNVFDVEKSDIEILTSKSVLFLTQPFVVDGILAEEEYISLLKKIFAKYSEQDILIKLHPRDNFDYATNFPLIENYSKPLNTQLLSFIGLEIKKVVTISSTAVNDMPHSTEVDWFGTSVHPKIERYVGCDIVPSRSYNQVYID